MTTEAEERASSLAKETRAQMKSLRVVELPSRPRSKLAETLEPEVRNKQPRRGKRMSYYGPESVIPYVIEQSRGVSGRWISTLGS